MRFYIEYLYLILMIMAVIFLATEFDELLKSGTLYPILIATALFAFMYVFRRSQRQQLDKYMDDKMRDLEEDDDFSPIEEEEDFSPVEEEDN
ncbi:MAG: hypothetical protein AB8H47_09315 [Bacteroidia bacterium]